MLLTRPGTGGGTVSHEALAVAALNDWLVEQYCSTASQHTDLLSVPWTIAILTLHRVMCGTISPRFGHESSACCAQEKSDDTCVHQLILLRIQLEKTVAHEVRCFPHSLFQAFRHRLLAGTRALSLLLQKTPGKSAPTPAGARYQNELVPEVFCPHLPSDIPKGETQAEAARRFPASRRRLGGIRSGLRTLHPTGGRREHAGAF